MDPVLSRNWVEGTVPFGKHAVDLFEGLAMEGLGLAPNGGSLAERTSCTSSRVRSTCVKLTDLCVVSFLRLSFVRKLATSTARRSVAGGCLRSGVQKGKTRRQKVVFRFNL